MNKRSLNHTHTRLRPLRHQYFFIISICFLVLGLYGLRQNNLRAIQLRNQVLKVDEQNGDVEAALKDLRVYVYSHMNSGLNGGSANIEKPVKLKYRSERLFAAEKAKESTDNTKVYNDAQKECERLHPEGLSGRTRVPCIEEYVASHNAKEQPIPDSLYKFDFVAPRWSPDLAGISLLLSAVFMFLFITRYVLERWMVNNLR